MQNRCDYCGTVMELRGEIFGDREKADVECPGCGRTIWVVNPTLETLRQETTKKKVTPVTSEVGTDGRRLHLPENAEISLRALEGRESGTVYAVPKPRMTIGRANADIIDHDPMMSRIHCALEVSDEGIRLLDLGSTNGTFVNDQQIESAALSNGSTFRAGEHLFQVVISPKET
ncbi:MAG TPA: FHA domain-containing protein [Terriglobia bacterium]|nr:FHA domain-containing protein [Terriglobia bacterium]